MNLVWSDLALLKEIRTWGVVREGRCSKKSPFFSQQLLLVENGRFSYTTVSWVSNTDIFLKLEI
jgi:hypothetical protein